MNNLSTAAKLLILTWVIIGILATGAVGFYFGRKTVPKQQGPDQDPMMQQGPAPSGQPGMQQSPPPGEGQQPQGGFQQPPQGPNQGSGQSPPPASGQPVQK